MHRSSKVRRPMKTLAVFAAAGSLLLAGCSAGEEKKSAEDGPLTKYLSALWDDKEYTQEQMESDQQKVEESVASCMHDQGFEYQPNVQSGGSVVIGTDDGPQWGTEEFAKEYGYGIVKWPGSDEMESEGTDSYVDPNQKYLDSLSDSVRSAYYEALYGAQTVVEDTEGEGVAESQSYDLSEMGCYGAAQQEVNQNLDNYQKASTDPEFKELFADLEGMWGTGSNNELMQELNSDWSSCMADAGYDGYATVDDPQNGLYDDYSKLQMPDGDDGNYTEPSKADKDKFMQREIEIATADAKCRKQIGYEDKLLDNQFQQEQEFVDAHQAQLDALVAKYGVEKKK